jgi:16S rRNA G966 N2-methylase RsmD
MPDGSAVTREPTQLDYSAFGRERLTHYLLRYPAKFHPPVVRALLDRYADQGMRLLDPFCGSGTALIEAAVKGLSATGTDIDPLAVFATRVKAYRHNVPSLRRTCATILDRISVHERSTSEYERLMFEDIADAEVEALTYREINVPAIPKLLHWFRRYVVVDLALISHTIRSASIPAPHRDFLLLCFASIIRAASNADPVPVSGLEVTAHMKERDRSGRLVNPFALFERTIRRSLDDVESFVEKSHVVKITAVQLDATRIRERLRGRFDIGLTSPPYNNAVDYYRRHQLEMFWLGLTKSQDERLSLKPGYIGRAQVSSLERRLLKNSQIGPLATTWYEKMREASEMRADAFKLYITSLAASLSSVSAVLHSGAPMICVVGHSRWQGNEIPLTDLIIEAASPALNVDELFYYPVSNRYMSYERRNGASIDREYAVILRKPVGIRKSYPKVETADAAHQQIS